MRELVLEVDADEHHAAGPAADFSLAHLSDLHLSSLIGVAPLALAGKRWLGYLSWRRKRRHEHRTEVLDALRLDVQAAHLDHVAVTGDLTHLGLPHEFREAASWLARLGGPEDITVVPGNHDAYVREAWRDTFAQWSPYLRGDGAAAATESAAAFPSLRLRREVALIGLSTARPSLPLLATGRLGAAQIQRLDRMLEETGRAGLFRVVMLHHPPAAHTVGWRKSLLDSAALREVLARRGAELVLHGHAHHTAAAYLAAGSGRIPAIGVPSSSAIGTQSNRRAAYHVYRITRTTAGWRLRVSVRAFSLEEGRFIPESGLRLREALTAADALRKVAAAT